MTIAYGAPEISPADAPRYDLTSEEVAETTANFLQDRELPDSRFVCTKVMSGEPLSNAARTVEREVFEASFGNSSEDMEREYGPYEFASHFYTVIDTEKLAVAGVLRVITNSSQGLKTLNDVPEHFPYMTPDVFQDNYGIENLDTVWDVGTTAILPEYRSRRDVNASALLFRASIGDAGRQGATDTITVADSVARKGFDGIGMPFQEILGTEGGFTYLGSPLSYALHGPVDRFFPAIGARAIELDVAIEGERRTQALMRKMTAKVAGQIAFGGELDRLMI